jgi:tRNA dimethylallyltransferase
LNLRAELEATPLEELVRELAERDPATYETIDRKNPRRVIRAIEVIRLTGKPFSVQRARWGETPGEPPFGTAVPGSRGRSPHQGAAVALSFGITRATADLRARIDERVDEMFQRGLVAETEQLLKRGLAQNKTAMQALGYRQVIEHLRGERSLADTIALVKLRTRQFAKRQMTWFRGQMELVWIEIGPNDASTAICDRLMVQAGTM